MGLRRVRSLVEELEEVLRAKHPRLVYHRTEEGIIKGWRAAGFVVDTGRQTEKKPSKVRSDRKQLGGAKDAGVNVSRMLGSFFIPQEGREREREGAGWGSAGNGKLQ